ncbi:MAG TPA: hypothetical protein VK797_22755 [Tepidisphaeraceae bacterium]|nr:hypothetical protein [Tepidisphaeraceae bacterium]
MSSTLAKSRYREARQVWTMAQAVAAWQAHFPAIRQRAAVMGQISRNIDQSLGSQWREVDVEAFLAEFDPSRSYSRKWWEQKLGSAGFAREIEIDHYMIVREAFAHTFSFTIPSTEALNAIRSFIGDAPVIEYFAGRGYWAYLLNREFGVQITATDRNQVQGEHSFDCSGGGSFMPVDPLDIGGARLPNGFVAMIAWIPYLSTAADRFLKRMQPGEKLILIGEWGGCCAADSTFDILEKHFEQVSEFAVPQFYGLHDRGCFLERR